MPPQSSRATARITAMIGALLLRGAGGRRPRLPRDGGAGGRIRRRVVGLVGHASLPVRALPFGAQADGTPITPPDGRGASALRSPHEHTFEQNGCSKVCLSRMPNERSSVTLPRMCGIVGYVGSRPALSIVLDGLRRLEYRGSDSAGVAALDDGTVLPQK